MVIALPVNDNSVESGICCSFGRAPYFLIFDTKSKASLFLENYAIQEQEGAGIKAAQMIVDNRVDALLTPRCGENAARVFKTANIILYKTITDSVNDNIAAFQKNQLSVLSQTHAGFHGHNGE